MVDLNNWHHILHQVSGAMALKFIQPTWSAGRKLACPFLFRLKSTTFRALAIALESGASHIGNE
jgi:hypothetical protein